MEDNETNPAEPLRDVATFMPQERLAPAHSIAAIALSMAMKYHDINTVQDGVLYQQYKLDGTNMQPLHLDVVFDTAIRIERHLMASSDRIAGLLVEALMEADIVPVEDPTDQPPA